MKTIYLTGKGIISRRSFHDAISRTMNFPDYYGKNLDALHDQLTEIGEETVLTIDNSAELEKNLGTYWKSLNRVLLDAERENPHFHFTII